MNKAFFSDNLSPHWVVLFQLTNFPRQRVSLLRKMIHLIDFWTQTVASRENRLFFNLGASGKLIIVIAGDNKRTWLNVHCFLLSVSQTNGLIDKNRFEWFFKKYTFFMVFLYNITFYGFVQTFSPDGGFPNNVIAQDRSLLLCCYYIWSWKSFSQKFIASLSTPWKKCFNNFAQSSVGARRQSDENPNSSAVAKKRELRANSSYDYQIMDRFRYTVTKVLNDGKTHCAMSNKMFKRPHHNTNQLYEVELVKHKIEQREPTLVGSFILQ